jgi:predicted dehydrogenase
MNRRIFLKRAAITTGMLGCPNLLPHFSWRTEGASSRADRITVAGIGLGIQGIANLRAMMSRPEARVIAVCDAHETQRAKAKKMVDDHYGDGSCAVFRDFRELLARRDLDAVLICTPDHWHPLMAVEAARQGKHIYCEKPLGWSFRAAQAVRKSVQEQKVKFQFGTQQRSDRKFWQACSLVRNGLIGKLQTILVGVPGSIAVPAQPVEPVPRELDYDLWLGPAPEAPYSFERCRPYTSRPDEPWTRNYSSWYHISDYCIGFIGNWGIHHLDIAQWGHGSESTGPTEIEGTGEFPTSGLGDCALSWQVANRFADGVTLVHMDDETSKRHPLQVPGRGHGVTFLGSDGWIRVDRGNLEASRESVLEIKCEELPAPLLQSGNHHTNFLNAIRQGDPLASPIEVAVRSDTLHLLDQIAIKLERKLRWDPVSESFVDDQAANGMLDRPMRTPWKL